MPWTPKPDPRTHPVRRGLGEKVKYQRPHTLVAENGTKC